MKKRDFEALDLFVFLLISAGLEALIIFAFNQFGHKDGYIVSFIPVIGLICIYRWGWIGVIVPILSGLVDVFMMSDSTIFINLASTLGNVFLLASMFVLQKHDKKKMSKDFGLLFIYYIVGYLSLEIGKTVFQLFGISSPADILSILYSYFVLDLMNIVFGLAVLFVAYKQKSILYDMNIYIEETSKTSPTSRRRDEINNYLSLESMANNDEVSDIALLDGGMVSVEDLEKQDETYRKLTRAPSKYDIQNRKIEEYNKNKKKSSKKKEEED